MRMCNNGVYLRSEVLFNCIRAAYESSIIVIVIITSIIRWL